MNAPAIATAAALLLPGYILDKSQYVHACGMCEYVIAYQSLTLLVASTLCITYYILSPAEFANKYDWSRMAVCSMCAVTRFLKALVNGKEQP